MDAIRAEVPAADSAPVVMEVPEAEGAAPNVGEENASVGTRPNAPAVLPEPRDFSREMIVGLLVGGVTVWLWTSDSDLGESKPRYPRAAVLEVGRPDTAQNGDAGPPTGSKMFALGAPAGGGSPDIDPLWRREIASHAAAIGHRSVLLRALKSPRVIGTAWHKGFESSDLAAVSLARSLRVRPVPGTALIEVLVATGSPQEQVILTTELVQLYLEDQRQLRTLVLLDRTMALNTMRIKVESRMRDVDMEIRELVRSVAAYRHRMSSSAGTATTSAATRPADQELAERQEMAWEEEKLSRSRDE